jgi:hypothetical protein
MSGWYKTGNQNHDAACVAAEGTRQAATAAASSQASANAADVAFHRSIIASARLNGLPIPEPSINAPRSLGFNS